MPENSYFAHYIPLLFQVIVAIALATVMVTLSHLLGNTNGRGPKTPPMNAALNPPATRSSASA